MKDCNQCGKCCTIYGGGGLSATASEIEFWEVFRPGISSYVSAGSIWVSPDTGKQLERCPWLRQITNPDKPNQAKYICDIYYDRPEECKHYPVTIAEMVKDGCEMLEVKDLAKPKQAQRALDRLMADSRPPVE